MEDIASGTAFLKECRRFTQRDIQPYGKCGFTLNGLSFHYRDWGGTGQLVVLLHGLASTCQIWDLVAPILADDYAVVALDQRGHGRSAKPDYGYDFATVGGDLLALIEAKGMERPLIAGHSWGGDVALSLRWRIRTWPWDCASWTEAPSSRRLVMQM